MLLATTRKALAIALVYILDIGTRVDISIYRDVWDFYDSYVLDR